MICIMVAALGGMVGFMGASMLGALPPNIAVPGAIASMAIGYLAAKRDGL